MDICAELIRLNGHNWSSVEPTIMTWRFGGKQHRIQGRGITKPILFPFDYFRNVYKWFKKIDDRCCGNHKFIGSKDMSIIDFEKLIPPSILEDYELEDWFIEAFKEQNIDSTIRETVLKIITKTVKSLPINLIHYSFPPPYKRDIRVCGCILRGAWPSEITESSVTITYDKIECKHARK